VRTKVGVLPRSDAQRSQSRSSGSVMAEFVDCVDGEISLPHHPNGIVPEKRPSHAGTQPNARIVDGKPTSQTESRARVVSVLAVAACYD
jgi:hypothetical protein